MRSSFHGSCLRLALKSFTFRGFFFLLSINYLLLLGIELLPHVVLHVLAQLQPNETHPACFHFGPISIRNGQYQLEWKNPWVLPQRGVHHWSQQGSGGIGLGGGLNMAQFSQLTLWMYCIGRKCCCYIIRPLNPSTHWRAAIRQFGGK